MPGNFEFWNRMQWLVIRPNLVLWIGTGSMAHVLPIKMLNGTRERTYFDSWPEMSAKWRQRSLCNWQFQERTSSRSFYKQKKRKRSKGVVVEKSQTSTDSFHFMKLRFRKIFTAQYSRVTCPPRFHRKEPRTAHARKHFAERRRWTDGSTHSC